jgi:hypothetical protein
MRPIVIFILVVREAVHVAYRKLDQAALMLRDFDAEEQEGQKYIWCKFGTKQVQGPVLFRLNLAPRSYVGCLITRHGNKVPV